MSQRMSRRTGNGGYQGVGAGVARSTFPLVSAPQGNRGHESEATCKQVVRGSSPLAGSSIGVGQRRFCGASEAVLTPLSGSGGSPVGGVRSSGAQPGACGGELSSGVRGSGWCGASRNRTGLLVAVRSVVEPRCPRRWDGPRFSTLLSPPGGVDVALRAWHEPRRSAPGIGGSRRLPRREERARSGR